MHTTPYTRFSVAKEKLWNGMPFRDRLVLKAVLAQGSEDLFKVSDLMILQALGSPATIHSALMNLIGSGHLQQSTSPQSGRSKFISLTKTSNTLFKKLNNLLIASATKY